MLLKVHSKASCNHDDKGYNYIKLERKRFIKSLQCIEMSSSSYHTPLHQLSISLASLQSTADSEELFPNSRAESSNTEQFSRWPKRKMMQ